MPIWSLTLPLTLNHPAPTDAKLGLLDRAARMTEGQQMPLLAYHLSEGALRLVMDADDTQLATFTRAFRAGSICSVRNQGGQLRFGRTWRRSWPDATSAIAWAHHQPQQDPRDTPWTSHREWLGYRHHRWIRPGLAHTHGVRKADLHRRCGGGTLPQLRYQPRLRDMPLLRTVCADVLARMPHDPKVSPLFAHVAALEGWSTADIAGALGRTCRRARQLRQQPVNGLRAAQAQLSDPAIHRWRVDPACVV